METKKLHFYIFCEENEKNKIYSKLVRTYVNRLCITEEDQSELIEVHEFEKISNFENLYFQPFSVFRFLLELAKTIFLNETIEFYVIPTILDLITKLSKRTIRDDDKFQFHFIFGFDNKNFAEKLVAVICNELKKKYPRNDLSFTLLQGYRKNDSQNIPNKLKTDLTIGDDIELLICQLQMKDSTQDSWRDFHHKSVSSSVIQKSDDAFMEIKCKRKSYTSLVDLKPLYKPLHVLLFTIYSICVFSLFLDGFWFNMSDHLCILMGLACIPLCFYFTHKMYSNGPNTFTICWNLLKIIEIGSPAKRFFVIQIVLHVLLLFCYLCLLLIVVYMILYIDDMIPYNLLFMIWTDETLLYLTF